MLHFDGVVTADAEPVATTLTLPFDVRQKSRFRAVLDDGREASVVLPRGTVLRDGDVIAAGNVRVRVQAAPEAVSVADQGDALTLMRAAYHLGNRHVQLQIGPTALIYQHDHVLDAMVRELGLRVRSAQLKFDPEPGAYGQGGHGHGRAHHGHRDEHEHHDHHEHEHHEHGHHHDGEHAHGTPGSRRPSPSS